MSPTVFAQSKISRRPLCVLFLRITLMHICKGACLCSPLRPLITIGIMLILIDWLNYSCFFSLPIYGFAVDTMHCYGPSN